MSTKKTEQDSINFIESLWHCVKDKDKHHLIDKAIHDLVKNYIQTFTERKEKFIDITHIDSEISKRVNKFIHKNSTYDNLEYSIEQCIKNKLNIIVNETVEKLFDGATINVIITYSDSTKKNIEFKLFDDESIADKTEDELD